MGTPGLPFPIVPSIDPATRPQQRGPQVTPYQQNTAAGIVGGINDFVNNYLSAKEMGKSHAQQEFMQGIQMKMMGLPVDDEKIMKAAKQSGLPLQTEPYTPAQKAAKAQSQAQSAGWAQLQGGGQPDPNQMQAMQAQPLDPGRAPQPGLLERMGLRSGQVSSDSPAGDWLRELGSSAKVGGGLTGQLARQGERSVLDQKLYEKGVDLSSLSMDQQKAMLGVTSRAMTGDPQALELMQRSKLWEGLPGDDISRAMQMADPSADPSVIKQKTGKMLMWMQSGGPAMQAFTLGMAKDLLPRFGGDMTKALKYAMDPFNSTDTPNFTPDEIGKIGEMYAKLHDTTPNAPPNLLMDAAVGTLTGNKGVTNAALKTLSEHYKTSGDVNQGNKDREFSLDQFKAQTGRIEAATGQVNAQTSIGRLGVERQQLDLSKLKTIVDASGDQAKMAWSVINDKNATRDAQKDAWEMLASSVNKDATLKVKIGDQEISIKDPVNVVNQTSLNPFRLLPQALGLDSGNPHLAEQKPPDDFWGAAPQQAAPLTRGSHGPQQQIIEQLRGLDQKEGSAILKKAFPDNYDQVLRYLRPQPQVP